MSLGTIIVEPEDLQRALLTIVGGMIEKLLPGISV